MCAAIEHKRRVNRRQAAIESKLGGVMTETTSLRPFARKRLIVIAVSACFTAEGWANPTAPQVVNGSANVTQAGKLLTVTNSNGAIINWNTFSIGAGEATRFNQPTAASSVLNRVVGNDPSVILGNLSSNGRVWLVNPAGIMVGQGARIDVGAFIASSLSVRNEDFLAGRLNFQATPGAGKVSNHGLITTPSGGSVYLVGPTVENGGVITAPNGEVLLAAGQKVELLDTGTPGVKVEITGSEGNATNLGTIASEAGRIGIAGVLVKNSGTLNASSVVSDGGRVFLKASKDATIEGGGQVLAKGTKGGNVEVLGDRVALTGTAQIDASGQNGGGQVLIGGDYQGANAGVKNAIRTYVGPGATIDASATGHGNGGKVVVWANGDTRFYGTIATRGGEAGGDAGHVEVSGKRTLGFAGHVDTSAPRGKGGSVLLDPDDIFITVGSGSTPATAADGLWSFSEDAGSQSIGANYVVTLLGTGSLTLQANNNIDVAASADVNYSGANDRTLLLQAKNSIIVNSGAQIRSTGPNKLNVTLHADSDNSGAGAISTASGSSTSRIGLKKFSPSPIESPSCVTGKLSAPGRSRTHPPPPPSARAMSGPPPQSPSRN